MTSRRVMPGVATSNRLIHRLIQGCLIAGSFVALVYYFSSTGWGVLELPRALIGVAALWGPAGALIYLLLRAHVADSLTCFTLSAIGSYALTTLAYFGAAVLGVTPVFYGVSILVAVSVAAYLVRRRAWTRVDIIQRLKNIDWILVLLVAASLVVNIKYQIVYSVSPDTNDRTYLLYPDHTLFASQVYELARHTPPLQQSMMAGIPERAYHVFPYLTTMLVARFTGQGDVLRAHLVYEYTIIEILTCLALYCIVKILTRSRWGGYIGVAVLYIFAVPLSPIINKGEPYFYFTYYPYPSSGLEPVVITSPQMYSGLLVLYGIMLGVLLVSINSYQPGQGEGRAQEPASTSRKLIADSSKVFALLVLIGLMVGAMLRFRIQIYIPLIAGFLLLAGYGLLRARQLAYIVGSAVAVVVSALLSYEMQSPVYLKNTAVLSIGNNNLAFELQWMNYWPFSESVRSWLQSTIPDKGGFAWSWQFVCMSCFVLFNMVGIPLILATIVYLFSRPAFKEWRLYTGLSLWLVVASTVGATSINSSYDSYSVGGQMLLHTGFYLLPFMSAGVWSLLQIFGRIPWSRQAWVRRASVAVGAALVSLAIVVQETRPLSVFQLSARIPITISPNEWLALSYIHDSTPQDSVIISDKYDQTDLAVFSGIGGRAGYYDFPSYSNKLPESMGNQPDRLDRIRSLWSAGTPEEFCPMLTSTVATHLVEYSSSSSSGS